MNSKLFLDQVPDPVTGPQRRLVPQLFRSFKQPSHQPLALLLIQQGLAASAACRLQRPLSFFGNGTGPPAYRLTAHLDTPCHFTLVVSLLQQLESLKTSPLQCAEVPFHATSIAHTGKTTRVPILLRYIMRNSVVHRSRPQYVDSVEWRAPIRTRIRK